MRESLGYDQLTSLLISLYVAFCCGRRAMGPFLGLGAGGPEQEGERKGRKGEGEEGREGERGKGEGEREGGRRRDGGG